MIRRSKKTKIPDDRPHREQKVALDLVQVVSESRSPYGTSLAGSGEEGQVILLHRADWRKGLQTYRVTVKEI